MKLTHTDMNDMRLALAHRAEALKARGAEYYETYAEDRDDLRADDAEELARVELLIKRLDDEYRHTAHVQAPKGREVTADETEGMRWWNSLTVPERSAALDQAAAYGDVPSAADAWAEHKRRSSTRA